MTTITQQQKTEAAFYSVVQTISGNALTIDVSYQQGDLVQSLQVRMIDHSDGTGALSVTLQDEVEPMIKTDITLDTLESAQVGFDGKYCELEFDGFELCVIADEDGLSVRMFDEYGDEFEIVDKASSSLAAQILGLLA